MRHDLKHELNHCMPAASHAKLGDLLDSMISQGNAILALMDRTGAFVSASETVTVGGSITAGNTVTVSLSNALLVPLVTPVSATHSIVGGDTDTTIAAALAASLGANPSLVAVGVTVAAVGPTFVVSQPGVVANSTVVTGTVSASGTETLAFTNSGSLVGGKGVFGNGNSAALAVLTLEQKAALLVL